MLWGNERGRPWPFPVSSAQSIYANYIDYVIKPDQDATYMNTVDILDEMTINQVRTYAMVKILPQEY